MKNVQVALLVLAFGARCASIAHGRYQNVPVQSSPSGAAIHVDCGDIPADGGVTPAPVKLRRGADHCAITLSKAGYADQIVRFTRMHSAVTWGNLGAGLLLGGVAGAYFADPVVVFDSANNDRASAAALAGIAAGTGIGVLVDRHTGALYRQVPSSVDVQLQARP